MVKTAVLLNDFGEIGLDDVLVEHSEDQLVELSNECICCSMQEDLVATLGGLAFRRDEGRIPHFERVVIETTGLADPTPIMRTLLSYPYLMETFSLNTVVTLVDAVNGHCHLWTPP
jgi:G3E family GTPase